MEQEPNSRKLLRIHKDDNVLIVVNSVQPGDKDVSEGYEIVFTQRIAIGNKVASRLTTWREDLQVWSADRLSQRRHNGGRSHPFAQSQERLPGNIHAG